MQESNVQYTQMMYYYLQIFGEKDNTNVSRPLMPERTKAASVYVSHWSVEDQQKPCGKQSPALLCIAAPSKA